jgi:hypothetical protein
MFAAVSGWLIGLDCRIASFVGFVRIASIGFVAMSVKTF